MRDFSANLQNRLNEADNSLMFEFSALKESEVHSASSTQRIQILQNELNAERGGSEHARGEAQRIYAAYDSLQSKHEDLKKSKETQEQALKDHENKVHEFYKKQISELTNPDLKNDCPNCPVLLLRVQLLEENLAQSESQNKAQFESQETAYQQEIQSLNQKID